MAWYQEWFGEKYLELYAHRDADEAERHLDFVEEHFDGEQPQAVLDLASGAGRHTDALRRRGYRAVGVDLSLTLLAQEPELPSVRGDMRHLPFAAETFDWVLNFFTSFGYFESERENFEVLEEIARILRPGGRFLIDLFNRQRVVDDLVLHEVQEREGYRVRIERWFDEETRRVNKQMELEGEDGSMDTFLESVRAYSHEEVAIGLQWAGLEVTGSYGNFNGETFHSDSERLILVGKKAT